VRKKPPDWGYVHWDKAIFDRLVSSDPEPLVARFQISHGMLLSVLGRSEGGCHAMKALVKDSLEPAPKKRQHKKYALELLRSLWQAGVIEFRSAAEGGGIRLNAELQENFSLLQALGLYVVDAVERLDPESPSYALDVLGLVEAIVEDPDVILRAQVDKLKGQKVAELKAAGVEYEERMIELDKVEHPKPNAEFLYESFAAFEKEHPWVSREVLRPKSIAREMLESLQSFSGYIKEYGLSRSEGVLLRYLSEVYKTLIQSIPELARTPELEELIETLGTLVRGVDSSLLDEWERLKNPDFVSAFTDEVEIARDDITQNTRVFTALIRNLLFSILRALQDRDYETVLDLAELGTFSGGPAEIERAIRPLFEEGFRIQLDAQGRSPTNTEITKMEPFWLVSQAILINDEVSEYSVRGRIDLVRSAAERRPVFLLDHVGAS